MEVEEEDGSDGEGVDVDAPLPPTVGAPGTIEVVEVAGLEPLVEFLAVALWKCHAAEATSASSLGNPIKRSLLSTLAFPQGGAAIRRLWLHLLTRHAAVRE